MDAGKKMVLRIRKRPGMEREDVLAAPRGAGGAGGSMWGKLLGSGTNPTPAVGASCSTRMLRISARVLNLCESRGQRQAQAQD
jgi:hypothetical protein